MGWGNDPVVDAGTAGSAPSPSAAWGAADTVVTPAREVGNAEAAGRGFVSGGGSLLNTIGALSDVLFPGTGPGGPTAIPGTQDTAFRDRLIASGIDPQTANQLSTNQGAGHVASDLGQQAQQYAALKPGETLDTAGKVSFGVGQAVPVVAGAVAAGGGASAEGLIPGAVKAVPYLGRIASSIGAGAGTAGALTAEQVANADEKVTPGSIAKEAAINLGLAGLPGAVGDSALVRALTGAGLGAGTAAAGNYLENKPQDTTSDIVGAIMGAGLAAGHAGAEPPMDPYLRNYQEGRANAPAPAPQPPALPPPTNEPATEAAPPAPSPAPVAPSSPKPDTALVAASFRADPRTALQALDHPTLVQVAQDAGFDVSTKDAPKTIVDTILKQPASYLESDVLPEYLANLSEVPAHEAAQSGQKPAGAQTPMPQAPTPSTPEPAARSIEPGATIPIDTQGTAYTPEQGAQSFNEALDRARGISGRLPEPVTTVDSQGNAIDSASFTRALDQAREEAQNRLDMGITPDIERTQNERWIQQHLDTELRAQQLARQQEIERSRMENIQSDAEREQMVGLEDLQPELKPWWAAGPDAAARIAGERALKNAVPDAPSPLPATTPVDTSHDVTLGGGVAKDNSRVYIDKDIPQFIDVPKEDGSGMARVNAWQDIAFHEEVEKPELDRGTHYFDAHEQNANSGEDGYLRQKYGVTRAAVDKVLKPYLDAAAAKNPETSNIPADLDRKPYEDGGDTHLLPEASNELAKLNIPEELHPQAMQFLAHVENALDAGVTPNALHEIARGTDDLPSKLAKINQLTQEAGGHALTHRPETQGVPRETATGALRQAGEAGKPTAQQGLAETGNAAGEGQHESTISDRSDQLAQPIENDYHGDHRPPGPHYGAPLHDLVPHFGDDIYGPKAAQYFGHGELSLDHGTARILKSLRGKPDQEVTIYRAVPREAPEKINAGDWVTVNRKYAEMHAASMDDAKVIEGRAKAKELYTSADSFHEAGYYPENVKVEQPDGGAGGMPAQYRRADWSPQVEGRAITEIDSLIQRYGGSTLADSIANDLREHTTAQLIGQHIEGPEDLAALASVYRNPAFETMRYVYVDRAGNILGETAVSSRMPSTTHAFPTGTDNGAVWVKEKAPQGATGVWLIHNHPSGDPTASRPDISMTQSLSIRLGDMAGAPKLQGHVILDHNTFGHIDALGEFQGVQNLKGAPDIDVNRYGRGDFEMFEQRVTDPTFAAVTGKRIAAATPEDSSAIVIMDAQRRVVSVHTFPNDFLVTPRGAAMLSRLGVKRGAVGIGLVTSTSNYAKHRAAFEAGAARGLFRDATVVSPDGRGLSLNDTQLFPREQRKNYGQQSAGARARASGAVQAFENTPDVSPTMVSLSAVRRALTNRGMTEDQIKAMTPEQLRAEQATMRRRSEPTPEETKGGDTSSITNATLDEERAMKGKDALQFNQSRANAAAAAEAKDLLRRDPQAGAKIAAGILAHERALTQVESFVLRQDRLRIKADRRAAFAKIEAARASGNAVAEAAARVQADVADDQMEINEQALKTGKGLAAQALQANRDLDDDSYSMSRMVHDTKERKGAALSSPERDALEKKAAEIEKREQAVAAREQALRDARREPRKPAEQKAAKSKFDSLADQLKAIAQKDHMKPGCVV